MEKHFLDSSVFVLSPEQWMALGPYLWLCLGIAGMTVGAALKLSRPVLKTGMGLVLLPYVVLLGQSLGQPSQTLFGTSLEIDSLTRLVGAATGLFALVAALFSEDGGERDKHSEWGALLLTSVLGLSLLPGARDLVAFFVYLETLAIAGYILTALDTNREKSLEAGLKYLLMGAFASAVLLMGMTLLFGLSGSFDYEKIYGHAQNLAGFDYHFALAGALLIVSGLLFKVAVVPFHMWAPDAYQGGPTAMAAYLAAATKLSVFVATAVLLQRSGLILLPAVKSYLQILGAASILVGGFLAVAQPQVRRLFAYAGVASAGYATLALSAGARANGSLFTYLLIYGGTLLCLFAIVEAYGRLLGRHVHADVEVNELGSAARLSPAWLSALFAFGVFSIASIPPLPGFFAKYLILRDLWIEGLYGSAAALLVGTLLGLAYYLRLLVAVYMGETEDGRITDANRDRRLGKTLGLAALAAAILTVAAMGGLSRLPQWVATVEAIR